MKVIEANVFSNSTIWTAHAYGPEFQFEEVKVIAANQEYAEFLLCEQLNLQYDDDRTVTILRGDPEIDGEDYEVVKIIPSFTRRQMQRKARRSELRRQRSQPTFRSLFAEGEAIAVPA